MNYTLPSFIFFCCKSIDVISSKVKKAKTCDFVINTAWTFGSIFDDEKRLLVMMHDYNQTKCGVDLVQQCINKYTVSMVHGGFFSTWLILLQLAQWLFGFLRTRIGVSMCVRKEDHFPSQTVTDSSVIENHSTIIPKNRFF